MNRFARRFVVAVGAAAIALPVATAVPAHAITSQLYVSASASTDPACVDASQANPFATIPGALGCALTGATINIGAGTFAGQFTISTNVTLRGAGASTVIQRPTGFTDFDPNITIAAGKKVMLRSLTVDGNGQVTAGVVMKNGHLTVRDATITGNGSHSGGAGGGIDVAPTTARATVLVVDSTISNNVADATGGGIYATGGTAASAITVVDSTISNNSAGGGFGLGGGGIAVQNASLDVHNSTITGNNVDSVGGGGVFADANAASITFTNSIVAANTAASGAPDCEAFNNRPTVDGGHNLIGQNTGAAVTGCPGFTDGIHGDQVGTNATPLDPVLAPLATNGGQTQTRALLLGSPAINTGDPTACTATPVHDRDQRHRARHTTTRLLCDIGAYDTGGTPLQALSVDRSVTSDPTCVSAQPFATLAGALACAANGTTITLGRGIFPGQVSVTHNVIISGTGSTTRVRRPNGSTDFAPDVTVADGRTVELSDLRIDGNGQLTPGITAAGGHLLVRDTTVTGNGNHSPGTGGGIAVTAGSREADVLVFDSTIANNVSDNAGGGIWVTSASAASLTIVNSTVSGNTTQGGGTFGGGGVAVSNASLTARDSTITANTTDSNGGGGIFATTNTPPVSLTNTIVAGNTATGGGADCEVYAGRPTVDGGHNVIGENTGVVGTGCPGFTDGVNGDHVGTHGSPIDVVLAALASNGGPTATHKLLPGSPAIGAGDGADCTLAPVTNRDQRGHLRKATLRGTCDIGAYDTGGA
jgi:hypothetical protein